jgi:GH25 family lysozyme M1 (1,4-beta-N-acetylmuramidase)
MQFEDKGIIGLDISFYQADPRKNQFVDFQKMKDFRDPEGRGISFVIMKASQHNYADPAFAVNRAAARAVGLPRAFYHFLDYDADGKSQAQFYWNLIKDDPGEGPLIVDFEQGSGGWERLWDFLVELQRISKYPADRIWIYTGYYYWLAHGPETQAQEMAFIPYRLWLAAYTAVENVGNVKVPRPWLTAALWQQGVTTVYGPDVGVLSLEVDYNIVNGDRALFKRYWLTDYVPGQPEQPEEGENSMEYRVTWSHGVARRTKPHTGAVGDNTYTGLIYTNGMVVEVVRDNIPDANNPTDPNKVWVEFADGLYGASSYPTSIGVPAVRMEKVTEPAPEPEPEPTPCESESFSLKVDGFKEVSGTLECE